MSSVVDFAPSPTRDRQSVSEDPIPRNAPPSQHRPSRRSNTTLDNPARDRRGSTVSRMSTLSSPEGGLRHRHINRTNTVTTYREHPSEPETFLLPGAEPGIDVSADTDNLPDHFANLKAECQIQIIDYSDTDIRPIKAVNETLADRLAEPRPEDLPCRWISVNGLSRDVIQLLGKKYSLHRLAIEDLVHTHTRTKVDWYADHAYVVLTLQKLVRLHQHDDRPGKCDCCHGPSDSDSDEDGKVSPGGKGSPSEKVSSSSKSSRGWFSRKAKANGDVLPRYLDKDLDGKIDEFVQAHSGTSEETPIKPIRTLHRYESAQIPEHTAFMEKHSVLSDEDLAVSVEQVSIFLLTDNTIISFFEHSAEDVERPLLERLQSTETMLRRSVDASLMLQALIDAIVDLAVPVKDAYNKARKELQVDAMTSPDIKTSRALHIFGEEIDMLQNLFKPIVHLVNALRDHQSEPLLPHPWPTDEHHDTPSQPAQPDKTKRDREGAPKYNRKLSEYRRAPLKRTETATSVSITPLAHTYFGDVLDHCITMIQTLEQMDASATNISTLIFNTVGAKTNSFMMILAVVTVFFSPLTFISGYFGMNFASGSGLAHPFAFFWVVSMPVLVAFMLLVFGFMLKDNIRDFLAKRGIKAHRRGRRRARRLARR
jgi:Mg2+ and Co2+ transporter CorA